MRSNSERMRLAALIVAASVVGLAAPALAGARHHDRVYADSLGNLVIDSAAGYKRILVGEGKLAKQLSDYTSAGQPTVPVTAAQPITTGMQPAAPPHTMFWAVRRLSSIV